jgi:hypothetical protein
VSSRTSLAPRQTLHDCRDKGAARLGAAPLILPLHLNVHGKESGLTPIILNDRFSFFLSVCCAATFFIIKLYQ